MLRINKLDPDKDCRYCSNCKSTTDVYEIWASMSHGDIQTEKSIVFCRNCLRKIQESDIDSSDSIEL